jgi:FlaA1/EpsC-like NDP-sugar epimerase
MAGRQLQGNARAGGFWRRHRRIALVVADALLWCVAILVATVLRYDLHLGEIRFGGVAAVAPWAVLAQVASGFALGLYLRRWRLGSFDEATALWLSALATTAVVVVADRWLVHPRMIPLGAAIGAGIGAFVLMGSFRYGWRFCLERRRRGFRDGAARTLVFGAGEGGYLAILAMRNDPASPYFPVGLLDDDPTRRNLHMLGVRVLGDRTRMVAVAQETRADTVLIAIPSADSELIQSIRDLAEPAGLALKVLPPVGELYGDHVATSDIRDVTLEDLLGRHQVQTDVEAIAAYLSGKRVLVTGAGGSIGSELCRQIARFAPAELIMLDRDESALHALQLSIEGRALLDSPCLVLADIRDRQEVEAIFRSRRPAVVFHAAALKHLTLLERHPAEAVKTNIWGTTNVLQAAAACGVERFVNVSTDKAADPTSVLGYSKRVAECLTAGMAERGSGEYLSVRFGNVLASRGSVLDTFRSQVRSGGPLTVTDPEVTRYFMTIPEAVQLVIQAGAIGASGEALVLDMGKPVRIAAIAERLAADAPRPVRIVYTGLRPGEKRHEVLLGAREVGERRVHPLVTHVDVPALDPSALQSLDVRRVPSVLVAAMSALCSLDTMVGEATA